MTATIYRQSCGSLAGIIAHQSAGERPCGWCVQAEVAARLAAEAITWRPAPAGPLQAPVTAARAAVNAAALVAALDAYEAEHAPARPSRYRDELARRRQKRGAA